MLRFLPIFNFLPWFCISIIFNINMKVWANDQKLKISLELNVLLHFMNGISLGEGGGGDPYPKNLELEWGTQFTFWRYTFFLMSTIFTPVRQFCLGPWKLLGTSLLQEFLFKPSAVYWLTKAKRFCYLRWIHISYSWLKTIFNIWTHQKHEVSSVRHRYFLISDMQTG